MHVVRAWAYPTDIRAHPTGIRVHPAGIRADTLVRPHGRWDVNPYVSVMNQINSPTISSGNAYAEA